MEARALPLQIIYHTLSVTLNSGFYFKTWWLLTNSHRWHPTCWATNARFYKGLLARRQPSWALINSALISNSCLFFWRCIHFTFTQTWTYSRDPFRHPMEAPRFIKSPSTLLFYWAPGLFFWHQRKCCCCCCCCWERSSAPNLSALRKQRCWFPQWAQLWHNQLKMPIGFHFFLPKMLRVVW